MRAWLLPACLLLVLASPGEDHTCRQGAGDAAGGMALLQRRTASAPRVGVDSEEEEEEAAAAANAASRDGSRTPTVAVLKTYGNWTPWVEWLVERYSGQLARVDIQLAVLRDVSKLEPRLEAVRASIRRFGNATAPVCDVTWPAAQKVLGQEMFDSHGPYGKADPHWWQTFFDLLWWRECAPMLPGKRAKFVWMIEWDAFFNGDLAGFVQSYRDDHADLVARGFRIMGPSWLLYGLFDFGLKNGLRTFGVEDDLVRGVRPLPGVADGKCSEDIENYKRGLIFAQEHVTRYSARYFGILAGAMGRGLAGPSEAFKPTLCASSSSLGLGEGEACSMTDFAPIGGPGNWISPIYCWRQVHPEPERPNAFGADELPCDARWLDKWVHPAKLDRPGLRLEEC